MRILRRSSQSAEPQPIEQELLSLRSAFILLTSGGAADVAAAAGGPYPGVAAFLGTALVLHRLVGK